MTTAFLLPALTPDSESERDHLLGVLATFLGRSGRILVVSGAGCSTESGIPDYRAADGSWKRTQPVQYQTFLHSPDVRRRYWARSFVGWPRMDAASPNPAHEALARLEQVGHIHAVITQNVDGLHQRAGSKRVIDLHGSLAFVVCLECGRRSSRTSLQQRIRHENPAWTTSPGEAAPDGDAVLDASFEAFRVPVCEDCGGALKPDVVLYGESVPASRTHECFDTLRECEALLIVGTSLMVWSSYRFARAAAQRGLPIAAVNLGRTRADDLIDIKITQRCGDALPGALARLAL
jgi:NAD-dependent SIR2 family protein deacetylase